MVRGNPDVIIDASSMPRERDANRDDGCRLRNVASFFRGSIIAFNCRSIGFGEISHEKRKFALARANIVSHAYARIHPYVSIASRRAGGPLDDHLEGDERVADAVGKQMTIIPIK